MEEEWMMNEDSSVWFTIYVLLYDYVLLDDDVLFADNVLLTYKKR